MADFASWLNSNQINSIFFWAWNANSGDTGGLVADDWATIQWTKYDWLMSVGYIPYWLGPGEFLKLFLKFVKLCKELYI